MFYPFVSFSKEHVYKIWWSLLHAFRFVYRIYEYMRYILTILFIRLIVTTIMRIQRKIWGKRWNRTHPFWKRKLYFSIRTVEGAKCLVSEQLKGRYENGSRTPKGVKKARFCATCKAYTINRPGQKLSIFRVILIIFLNVTTPLNWNKYCSTRVWTSIRWRT